MVELIDPDAEAEDPAVPEEVMLNWSDEAWMNPGSEQADQLGADCKREVQIPTPSAEAYGIPTRSGLTLAEREDRTEGAYENSVISDQPDPISLSGSPTPTRVQIERPRCEEIGNGFGISASGTPSSYIYTSTRLPMASPRERSIFSLYDSPRRRDADRPSRGGLVDDQSDLAVGSGQSVLRIVIVVGKQWTRTQSQLSLLVWSIVSELIRSWSSSGGAGTEYG
jgi:hypothetical protein